MHETSLTQNHTLVKTRAGGYLVSESPATVRYDRSARQYIVANGREIGRYPSGPQNRVRAEWRALAYNDGRLYEAAQGMLVAGHDEGRLIRAANLILENRVLSRERDGGFARALVCASEGNRSPVTGQAAYHVYYNLVWTCDCEDWEGRRLAGERGHFCKHILAAMLLERLAGEDETAFEAVRNRQEEEIAERRASQRRAAASECPQCHGRGTVTGIDTWTGLPRTMRCACQIDF